MGTNSRMLTLESGTCRNHTKCCVASSSKEFIGTPMYVRVLEVSSFPELTALQEEVRGERL